MRSVVITLIAFAAGIGAGFALSPATWTAIAPSEKSEELLEVAAEPTLVDVTTLIKAGEAWGPEERIQAAARLDTILVANDFEVRVRAGGPGNQVLLVTGGFGRVRTFKLAKQFDFGSLQRAGFSLFVTESGDDANGYIVDRVPTEGLGAPLAKDPLIAHWRTLEE